MVNLTLERIGAVQNAVGFEVCKVRYSIDTKQPARLPRAKPEAQRTPGGCIFAPAIGWSSGTSRHTSRPAGDLIVQQVWYGIEAP